MTQSKTSYDEVPYHSKPYYFTHPNRLAAVATLHGLNPPALEHCRVLEIGCAGGGNLLPMAAGLPNAHFVGIDLSQEQIRHAEESARDLGISNIEFHAMNLMDFDDQFESFDYIISHGVFSWIPPIVQDKMLSICGKSLTSDGVAFISYNAYPGWHMHMVARDIMCHKARKVAEPGRRVAEAVGMLKRIAQSVKPQDDLYAKHLNKQAELIASRPEYYVYHEYLEDNNEPFYFSDFMNKVEGHGLQYLAEVDITPMARLRANLTQVRNGDAATLKTAGIVELEQEHDFLCNRQFRRTLLCRSHLRPNRDLPLESLLKLRIAAQCRPDRPISNPASNEETRFVTVLGKHYASARDPWLKTALIYLAEIGPASATFDAILREVCRRLKPDPAIVPEAQRRLAIDLMNWFFQGMIEFFPHPPSFSRAPGPKPRALPIAVREASATSSVTNAMHRYVTLNDFDRALIQLLDGSRDRDGIVARMTENAIAGKLDVKESGEQVRDPERLQTILRQAVDLGVSRLASLALLDGDENGLQSPSASCLT